uniref:FAM234A/B beta-propeller domain-containing protein n=2 Tax=Lygus hesperus TaxID=30085 RepID=A0A0A9XCY1_LYGHE
MGDYQRLQTEAEAEVHLHSSVNPSINKVYYARPMTRLHKATFIASILFCVGAALFFIWGLPCNLYQCTKEKTESISWDKTLTSLELKGRMHVVGGNLITILHNARWGVALPHFSPGGGVIALLGKNGDEVYWVALSVMPRYIDCSILDLVVNNAKACLIIGENGYMSALNSVAGLIIWKITAKDSPQPQNVDVPISIPDVDGDGHLELVTLSRYGKGKHRVAIISGRTGEVIKQPLLDPDCDLVFNLTYDYNTATVLYDCSPAYPFPAPTVKKLKLKDHLNIKEPPRNEMSRVMIPDDEKMRFIEGNNSAGEHKVMYSNTGRCPDDCFVSINVTDCQNKTIWSYHMDKTYVMNPIPLHFKHSITGFLLKLWQWHTPPQGKKIGSVRLELIKERIVLITFNKSESMHVVNASQTDIVQLCDENECQPHLSFQTQSALIADLNGDGTQDLISYFVTYKTNNEDPLRVNKEASIKNWILESRVRVVQLEAELHKLYEAVSKH